VTVAGRPDAGAVRWARALAYTAPAVGLSVLLHAAADGCVSVQGVAEASVTCLAAAGMALRAERSRAQIAGWLLACQLLTHLLLQVHCPPGDPGAFVPDARTALAHLAAAALAAAWLAPAERALWAASRLGPAVRRAVVRCTQPACPVLAPPVLAAQVTAPLRVLRPVLHASCPPPARRGPPVGCALV
jgi:hypothetical protein